MLEYNFYGSLLTGVLIAADMPFQRPTAEMMGASGEALILAYQMCRESGMQRKSFRTSLTSDF